MGGRGSSSGMQSTGPLRKIENSIRNNSVESAALVGSNGEVLFNKSDGLVGQVQFSSDEISMMRDGTLTHNHPLGTTFSKEDIDLAIHSGLKEIRAVHENGSYSLARQFQIGESMPKKYTKFSSDYNKAIVNYMHNTVDAIYNKTGDADKCNGMVADFRRQWLKQNSSNYGWIYKEGK